MAERYDVAIIGAGPGGYAAAIRAAQLGFKTICIDKRNTLGGTCLNVGCIPSKTLLHATGLFSILQREGSLNAIECSQVKMDFPKLMARKREVVKGLVDGVAGLFKKNGVVSLQGEASFIDPHRLRVSSGSQASEIEADSIILATGSEPIALPGLPFNEKNVVSSTGALSFLQAPKRLLVIGGGVIGVELASVYNRLGSSVTIIEMLDRLCPAMEVALTKQLLQILKKQGIQFKLSSKVVNAVVQPEEVILTVESEGQLQNVSGDSVLVAVGRRPYSQGLGLDKIGITVDRRGFVPVDGFFRTQQPHIFAIGDLIDGVMLAHRATEEGVVVIEWLKGERSNVNYLAIPNVIYTDPEVASVGLTEQEAKETGRSLLVGTSFFRGNSRARCTGETEGFVKVIGDRETGRLMGMHIIGTHASELIAEGMLAMQLGATLAEIGQAVQAHPTLSEAIKEAALQALGRPINS
ncbi:2-oxoglutarate dehydrogenase E3 component [Candidatus Protochlamydia naegleriophila]|uniref:Dihydrolipoyl dehydrogenase n=1 Tax=Candidatus Protochlamydia naegleriophila TaxID=389348 RepID=A0A0U5JCN4_9BACT|nr:dihydrolipoyl dehydrogenase [Candidatus Protochlamydia naegleriophila]CUI16418.1 2-oxoglutarate dehydrogenase E3 component [Candidatus Protochlamydia naegleriophila]